MGPTLMLRGYAARPGTARRALPPGTLVAMVLIAAAALIRMPNWGNPLYHIDDQLYLLMGRAMLTGELPYVDIWDRKPLGLFLIYAGIGLLGGDGVIQYQVVASLFAAATAIVIALIARRFGGWPAACATGLVYLWSLQMLAGGGGQSPVFYNLFMAGAALLTLRALGVAYTRSLAWRSTAAMLLAGLAIFVKPVAVFESSFFGLALLFAVWTKSRSPQVTLKAALLFAGCGIAPTAAAFGAYMALGHGDAFWFANVTSIFLKTALDRDTVLLGLTLILICIAPLAVLAGFGVSRLLRRAGEGERRDARFMIGWVVAAILGLAAVPNFFNHYALPLLVPLSVCAAPIFGRAGSGLLWSILPMTWAFAVSGTANGGRTERAIANFDRTTQLVERHLRNGCLYVHEGPVQLYSATAACRVTAYVFPDHLNSQIEAGAIGVAPEVELRRLLDRKPTVVVTARRLAHAENLSTRRILHERLRRDYCLAETGYTPFGKRRQNFYIWALPEASAPAVASAPTARCARRSHDPAATISAGMSTDATPG